VALTALHVVLLVRVLRLDHSAPVTDLQRDVERTRLVEYRALKWALLGGCLFWLPVPLVLIEALTGAPLLARVDLAWLLANLGVGAVILVVGQVLSRRYVERADLGPRARRVVEAVSGRGLRNAAA